MPRPDLVDISLVLAVVLLVIGAAKFPALGESIGRLLSRRGRSD
ncbi:MAG: twin-arginine translocase TatA/TatE family subunit [Pseudomonadota bacterium]|nr:MAG: hypothetical protein DIU72_03835 [Pseudomonadota bacterium]